MWDLEGPSFKDVHKSQQRNELIKKASIKSWNPRATYRSWHQDQAYFGEKEDFEIEPEQL